MADFFQATSFDPLVVETAIDASSFDAAGAAGGALAQAKAYTDSKIHAVAFNVKDFGATGDGSTDDTAEIQAAADAVVAAGGGVLFFPRGVYVVSSAITVTSIGSGVNQSGRPGGFTIRGVNMYQSVIKSTVSGYTFSISGEALHVSDLCVKTTSAGGFNVTEGGNVSFHRFFQDGCGAAYYGIKATVPYPLDIEGCRFWNLNADYQGGAFYVDGGICVNVRATFVSMMQKNGDICVFNNCYNVNVQSMMLESRVLGASTNTAQAYISLQGTNQCGYIDGIYTEGQWNKIIDIVGNTSARGFRVGSIYAFERDDNSHGDPNCFVISAPAVALSTPLAVDSIVFVGQPTASGGHLLNDPTSSITVRAFRNSSTGNQASRVL